MNANCLQSIRKQQTRMRAHAHTYTNAHAHMTRPCKHKQKRTHKLILRAVVIEIVMYCLTAAKIGVHVSVQKGNPMAQHSLPSIYFFAIYPTALKLSPQA